MTTKAKYLIVGVDDNFRVRESLTSLVESAGYCASMFGSAQGFLFSADVADADCVVTDVWMAGIDGIELAHNIHAKRAELPIIFTSANPEDSSCSSVGFAARIRTACLRAS